MKALGGRLLFLHNTIINSTNGTNGFEQIMKALPEVINIFHAQLS